MLMSSALLETSLCTRWMISISRPAYALLGAGQIYMLSNNQNVDALNGVNMQASSSVVTAGGNVRIAADNEGDIQLALVNAGLGSVSLVAEGSILDANGANLNVNATNLRAWADAVLNVDGTQDIATAGNGSDASEQPTCLTVLHLISMQLILRSPR